MSAPMVFIPYSWKQCALLLLGALWVLDSYFLSDITPFNFITPFNEVPYRDPGTHMLS